MGVIDLGNACTLSGGEFASGEFDWKLSKISLSVGDRASVSISTLGVSAAEVKTVLMDDTWDPGTMSIEGFVDPKLGSSGTNPTGETPKISGTSTGDTYTLTFPIPTGYTNAATIAFTGRCTSYSFDIPVGEAMTFSAEFKIMSDLTINRAT